jgi:hypothetical protein
MALAAVIPLAFACSGSSGESNPGPAVVDDPRPLSEICVEYCNNVRAHGCEAAITIGSSCQANCEYTPQGGAECQASWRTHTGCLADLPNLCDSAQRNQVCLSAFCRMRVACMLPDPQCR